MAKNKGKHRSERVKEAAPEEMVKSWLHHLGDFIKPHAVKLISLVVGLVVVFSGFTVWSYVQHKKQAGATRQFGDVVTATTAPVEGELDLAALQRGDQPDANAKKFKNSSDRAQAALATTQGMESSYGGTDVGRQTLLVQAGLSFDLGKYEEAIAAYNQFLEKGPHVPQLMELAREGIGYSWEAKALAEKDDNARNTALQNAFRAYQAIETDDKGPYIATALYHQARVDALMKDDKGAVALYKKALEKTTSPQLRQQINDRLGALQALHPELLTPAPAPAAPASQPAKP